MDFHRLEVFLKVFQKKSFSKAGETLYLTQPTVSEHIRLLEEDLGLVLFDRQGKEATPTRAGQLLHQYATQLMALRKESLRAMEQFRDKGRGDLLVGGSNIPGQYLLPPLLGRFKALYPRIRLRLLVGDTRNISDNLLQGVIELGCVGAQIDHRQINTEFLTTDEMICVISADHFGETKKKLGPEELVRLPFILREKGSGTRLAVEQALKKIGLELKDLQVVAEIGSNEAVRQGVKSGLGASIISRRAVVEDLEQKRMQELKIKKLPLNRNFYLISLKQRILSPLAEEFKAFVLKEAGH
jgi:DNA-binding transcriptional LysR family regulator